MTVAWLFVSAVGWAGEPAVSGISELVVIDPGTHERGLPAVKLERGSNGQMLVDIPPTLHVHRFYYSGDKQYQGPIVQGGPTMVVANHPRTGERKYLPVTLPQGAPIIVYTKHSIAYHYSDRRVTVKFGSWNTDKAHIVYKHGTGPGQRVAVAAKHLATSTVSAIHRSPTLNSVGQIVSSGGKFLTNGFATIDSATGTLMDRVTGVAGIIPGLIPIQSQGDLAPERNYNSLLDRASRQKNRTSRTFVPTNR